ncbi:MAG TPA: hypothetical protein VHZ97_05740 [Pseudonocardiaceae bacterium]|nr:hypothetical protein [Pseudonocardiaceae bacterium]
MLPALTTAATGAATGPEQTVAVPLSALTGGTESTPAASSGGGQVELVPVSDPTTTGEASASAVNPELAGAVNSIIAVLPDLENAAANDQPATDTTSAQELDTLIPQLQSVVTSLEAELQGETGTTSTAPTAQTAPTAPVTVTAPTAPTDGGQDASAVQQISSALAPVITELESAGDSSAIPSSIGSIISSALDTALGMAGSTGTTSPAPTQPCPCTTTGATAGGSGSTDSSGLGVDGQALAGLSGLSGVLGSGALGQAGAAGSNVDTTGAMSGGSGAGTAASSDGSSGQQGDLSSSDGSDWTQSDSTGS